MHLLNDNLGFSVDVAVFYFSTTNVSAVKGGTVHISNWKLARTRNFNKTKVTFSRRPTLFLRTSKANDELLLIYSLFLVTSFFGNVL